MNAKTIAVLGGGHGAHTLAADLKHRGHRVRLFEMPRFRENVRQLFETATIEVTGVAQYRATLDLVTDDIDAAVTGADYVLLVTPAFAHGAYAELLKGKLNAKQVLIAFPGGFAAMVLKKSFGDKNCPILVDSNTLPYDTRLTGPCKVKLMGYNNMRLGFMPASAAKKLNEQLREDLFDFGAPYEDVLECALSNVNPCLHTGPCLLSVSSIENPTIDFYLYEHGFTPSASKLDIALDNERKALGRAFGYKITCLEDFGNLPEGYTWQQLYMSAHGQIALTPIGGPNDIFNRYLTEDAFCGLSPWSSIARQVGVETPTIDSVLNIYSVIHETNWRTEGNTAEKLGIAGMSAKEIKKYVATGRRG